MAARRPWWSSAVGLALTLVPWLVSGGTLILHHPFDPDAPAVSANVPMMIGSSTEIASEMAVMIVIREMKEITSVADGTAHKTLGEALKPEFKAYQQQVVKNAQALATEGHGRARLGHEGGLVERDAMVFQAAKRIATLNAQIQTEWNGMAGTRDVIRQEQLAMFETRTKGAPLLAARAVEST